MRNIEIGELLLHEAENGNVDAKVDWATWRSIHNSDVPLSHGEKKRIVEYYTAGADVDNATALQRLGTMYFTGTYVRRNYKTAFSLFSSAAKRGDSQAMCDIGNCYYKGCGTGKNLEKAFRYYAQAALLDNNCTAYYMIGDMYMNGDYVEKSEKKAFDMYTKAFDNIESNDPSFPQAPIYARMGDCLYNGIGCEADPIEALRYLTQSECFFYRKKQMNQVFDDVMFSKVQNMIESVRDSICKELDVIGVNLM